MAELLEPSQLDAGVGVEGDLGRIRGFAAINGVEEGFDLGAGPDGLFDRAGGELVLVAEVRESGAG